MIDNMRDNDPAIYGLKIGLDGKATLKFPAYNPGLRNTELTAVLVIDRPEAAGLDQLLHAYLGIVKED